jgi:fructuronate reductase
VKRLSDATLSQLPPGIARPGYSRNAVQTGIVHLGLGAFHRAHMAAFTDDCLAAGATDWGITAASLRNADTRNALAPQDGLYTLALRENDAQALRIIGSIRKTLVAPESPQVLLAAMTDPAVRIVSLTVTEKGYAANVASGMLRTDDPDVQHDLAHPSTPRAALGFLTQALSLRRAAGVKPFTVLSCDNLPGNGHLLHRVLTEFATERDPALGRFVSDHVACPSTMVDRIVPATTDADRAMITARLGMVDAWPVLAEPFFQWVIEAAGSTAALGQALQVIRRGGTIVQVGTLPTAVTVPLNILMARELTLAGSFRFANVFATALHLMTTGQIDVKPLITSVNPLAEANTAMQTAIGAKHGIKVQIAP